MNPEPLMGEPIADRIATSADPGINHEIESLLGAVERDVAAGKSAHEAIRDRLGLVFWNEPQSGTRVPVDRDLLRAYVAKTLAPTDRDRVFNLIWDDPDWCLEHVRIALEQHPGSRPELLDASIRANDSSQSLKHPVQGIPDGLVGHTSNPSDLGSVAVTQPEEFQ